MNKCRRPRNARGLAQPAFLMLVAAAVLLILGSSRYLPATVASHFGAGGNPNGSMSRNAYLSVMLALVAIVPLVMSVAPAHTLRNPDARINLPNRDYWLAPERREQTIQALLGQIRWFAAALLVFLCYTNVLVVRANALAPPHLNGAALGLGVLLLLASLAVWALLLIARFRRP
ncbi:MAG: DUF1648 domain-containing protein [Proteobacteria bacterium]|nr:DUF1648 domain-containing protein [Pseudomonadota bacterium]